jgi:hypothetical protein
MSKYLLKPTHSEQMSKAYRDSDMLRFCCLDRHTEGYAMREGVHCIDAILGNDRDSDAFTGRVRISVDTTNHSDYYAGKYLRAASVVAERHFKFYVDVMPSDTVPAGATGAMNRHVDDAFLYYSKEKNSLTVNMVNYMLLTLIAKLEGKNKLVSMSHFRIYVCGQEFDWCYSGYHIGAATASAHAKGHEWAMPWYVSALLAADCEYMYLNSAAITKSRNERHARKRTPSGSSISNDGVQSQEQSSTGLFKN